jgi:hypothetical protein
MAAAMLVAAIVAGIYAVLIGMHVAAIRGRGPASAQDRPRIAVWIAAAGERRLSRAESDAVLRRMTGELDRGAYHTVMAAVAAQDEIERPLEVPKSLL